MNVLNVIIKSFKVEEEISKIFESHSTNDLWRRKTIDFYIYIKIVIGPFGIDKINTKGRIFLTVLIQKILRVANRYFNKPSFFSWRSFNTSIYLHMLDLITTSDSFLKHVRDCLVTPTRMRSDHSAVKLIISNRSMKFNSTYIECSVIDWKWIQDCENTHQLFNVNLQHMIKENMSYKLFNEAILDSAQKSAMTNNQSNKGWFHHNKSTITTELAAINAILHTIRFDQHPPSEEKILNLKTLQ